MSRQARWIRTEQSRMKYYRMAETRFYQLMRDEGNKLVDAIRTVGGGLEVIDSLEVDMRPVLLDVYRLSGREFVNSAFNDLKGIRNLTVKADVDDYWESSMVFYVEKNRFPLIQSVANTYKGVLNRAIQSGVAEGLGMDELAKRIQQVVPGLARNRAIVIARTEVINSSNMSANFGAIASGVSLDKEWIATMDNRTRIDHIEADAQIVGMDQPFILADGSRLMWPGDNQFSAAADQTINCRCTQGYVRPE